MFSWSHSSSQETHAHTNANMHIYIQHTRTHTHTHTIGGCCDGPFVTPASLSHPSEKERLRQLIDGLVWFEPTLDELHLYMDGGVAIIDQWIAAHSRHFVGTGHSTFSFRIREDRQLMGFSRESTFNSLCGDKPGEEGDIISCEQPSYWPMVEGTTPPREDL